MPDLTPADVKRAMQLASLIVNEPYSGDSDAERILSCVLLRMAKVVEEAPHAEDCGLKKCSKCNGFGDICDYDYASCPIRVPKPCSCWKAELNG